MAAGCNNNNVIVGGGGEDDWMVILSFMPLMPGYEGTRYHSFKVSKEATLCMIAIGGITHLRLNYFPNNKVARIRAYGRSVGRMMLRKTMTAPEEGVAPSLHVRQTIVVAIIVVVFVGAALCPLLLG
jgi:hypothetical protein